MCINLCTGRDNAEFGESTVGEKTIGEKTLCPPIVIFKRIQLTAMCHDVFDSPCPFEVLFLSFAPKSHKTFSSGTINYCSCFLFHFDIIAKIIFYFITFPPIVLTFSYVVQTFH